MFIYIYHVKEKTLNMNEILIYEKKLQEKERCQVFFFSFISNHHIE